MPQPVGEVTTLLARLAGESEGHCVFAGFDFPIGLPIAYAERAGITAFREALPRFDNTFYEPAERVDEISLARPFYPQRPGGTKHEQLVSALGLARIDELLRRCDRGTGARRAAAPLFWTLGAQQVGRAAISGWRDLLAPALLDPDLDVRIWPFDGRLYELFARDRIVVAETYPREFYNHLRVEFRGPGKRDRRARAKNAEALLAWSSRVGLHFSDLLTAGLQSGFASDDDFDAVVGLLGMLNVVMKYRSPGEPDDQTVRRIEGWMLGLGGGVATSEMPAARGWSFSSLSELGDGPGFRKIRQALGITAFGANGLVLAPGVTARPHYHDEQDELYFVHAGRAEFRLPGETRELGPGGLCHVESTTPRLITSVGGEELVLVIVGAKQGYVGRDGHLADPAQLG
jgi:quercetin dioxygenase-like cupin family protein